MDSMQTSGKQCSSVDIKPIIDHDSSSAAPSQTISVTGKSDLRSTKTELFNKLIASQSQQMIVTTPNNNNNSKYGAENLNRASSLTSGKKHQQQAAAILDQQQYQQQPPNSTATKQLNNSHHHQQQQQFLPDDFKREPVVFARSRSRWYTNEEVASILTNFSSHPEWQTNELQVRPKSGAVLLYSREKVRYRQDGYCWKKRKNGRTTREDHMKLKVQGIECIYGCYVHSAILPTFHRRCYWLLQNPDIVLVHYLNQPPDDQNKMMITFNSSLLEADTRRSWTNEEIIEEIGSVFGGISQIQHTLNINFPPSTAIIHQSQRQQQHQTLVADSLDRMTESSPQSQQSQQTTNSKAMNEQVDMTIVDHQHRQLQHGDTDSTHHLLKQEQQGNDNKVGQGHRLDDDEMMTTMSQQDDSENNNDNTLTSANNQSGNLNSCEGGQQSNGHKQQNHHQLQQQDETISMTFDIVNECDDNENSLSTNGQPTVDCFGYPNSSNVNVSVINTDHNNNNINNHNNTIDQASSKQQTGAGGNGNQSMEQNPCSPVTQIYNKIVDDIETYALPLEPNQFNSNHHHSLSISSLPVQSMDIGDTERHQHPHHHYHLNHHHLHHQQQHDRGNQEEEETRQQFVVHDHSRDGNNSSKGHSECSMDLTTCDLFGGEQNRIESGARDDNHGGEGDEDDNLLLTEFNLPSGGGVGQVSDELGASCVVDSLTNVDDLRDLIMGISSNGNTDHSNLLVDANSLDLFNFKPANCEQRQQQLDVKSSTSDTDTMNRLSPLVAPVPRCNSTGNTMQPSSNQHLSNHFLTCTHANLITSTFTEFHNHNLQRSSSTNPSSSTSCSPSPSLCSLRTGVPTSSSVCHESAQYTPNSTTSSSHSLIKLPLQQRQKSEQQEPSNSVLNSLLPKALSLDGSDLSTANHHHRGVSTSPLVAYNIRQEQERHHQQQQPQQNLLLIPSAISHQHQQQATTTADSITHQFGGTQQHPIRASLSPTTIPLDNSSEILVNNNAPNDFHGSPAYNMLQQQHQPLLECTKQLTKNGLLPILDYVPNWCNITGGAKVLIVGNWSSLLATSFADKQQQQQQQQQLNATDKEGFSTFFAIFDDLLVPATLIQDNVLRCYAPSHEQGFITLKVLYMNRIVSDQVLFEMRPSCVQSVNQVASVNFRNNLSGGQDPPTDDNNNGSNNNSNNNNSSSNNNTQHRNSTSSSQSASSVPFANQQKPQISPSGNSISGDSSKVLTLAENIISAMHKKNNTINSNEASDSRLANSLDIESLDHYLHINSNNQQQSSSWSSQRHHQQQHQQQQQQHHHHNYSLKGAQRRLTGSRSLSRDSEPTMNSSYAMNLEVIDGDPYWHQDPLESETMQPLSVVTDFLMTNHQQPPPSNVIFGQKRHSSGSFGHLSAGGQLQQLHQHNNHHHHQQQQSAFMPYLQRPTLNSAANHQPIETQNLTETSSSGLGSIVSSLSPSTSSLHSPSSACTAATRDGVTRDDGLSPCSCGRQSSGTPTSADFCEYFQASAKTEESFASLTLNDREQQELYEAAKIIQKAYRTYRGRKRQASELLVEPNGRSGSLSSSCDQLLSEYQHTTSSIVGQQPLSVTMAQQTPEIVQVNDPQQKIEQQQHQHLCSASSSLSQQQFGGYLNPLPAVAGAQQKLQPTLVKCYRDREMQAAIIIQAYYRRYRQYVHYKRQQQTGNRLSSVGGGGASCEGRSPGARLVVDTMPIVIDKATTSHVDRKRFKTAILISSNVSSDCAQQQSQSQPQTRID